MPFAIAETIPFPRSTSGGVGGGGVDDDVMLITNSYSRNAFILCIPDWIENKIKQIGKFM